MTSVAKWAPRGGQITGAGYRRQRVLTYTDACEAPAAMWATGAIPLRRKKKMSGQHDIMVTEKTYQHPAEVLPSNLGFGEINGMYSVGNDEIKKYFAEGVGGKAFQLFVPGHPRSFLYRKQSHLLNKFIDKIPYWNSKSDALSALSGDRPGFIIDGPTGTGKSSLMAQAVHYARSRDIMTIYVPNAKDWTHGEWCWPSTLLPGFWDVPDAGRSFLQYFARSNRDVLSKWPLVCTPKDLPTDRSEKPPETLYDLMDWGHSAPAPSSVDRQSVAIKYLMDELRAEKSRPILFVIDGYNLFSHETHFRYPHPDFLRKLSSFTGTNTDVDMHAQELPRIPASRLGFVRGLNRMILDNVTRNQSNTNFAPNRFFITSTTRDFKPFDGGVSGFDNVFNDKHVHSLDEYAPYHPEKDSLFHPIPVGDFDEYEYRSFLRYLVNSSELAGSGWGPLWHYSSSFERKLYKIEFMSRRNPQRVIDQFHAEITWTYEYERVRQKQGIRYNADRRPNYNRRPRNRDQEQKQQQAPQQQ